LTKAGQLLGAEPHSARIDSIGLFAWIRRPSRPSIDRTFDLSIDIKSLTSHSFRA
jgi:hypothetical protein